MTAKTDRFGNPHAPNLSYARGKILPTTEDDFRKLQRAWAIIRERGPENIFIFTGLEHHLPMESGDLPLAHDEVGPSETFDELKRLTLDHLGGTPDKHDFAVFNRLTGATISTHMVLVKPGDTVIGVSQGNSHPSVMRANSHVGSNFIDTQGVAAFKDALSAADKVALVVLTRLAVTYDLMPLKDIATIVEMAHAKGAYVYVDDAGGARVGPALFDQPKMLQLGVDLGATGLDKYGTVGPRFGLMAGRKDLVSKIRAKGWEFGMEARPMLFAGVVRTLKQYSPERVRATTAAAKQVGEALRPLLGNRMRETPMTAQISADDLLELAMERGDIKTAPIVPYEATAALCMLMLKNYGMLTVHFVGVPPGGANMLIKFLPPETLKEFGGPKKFAQAMNDSITELGRMLKNPESLNELFFGESGKAA